MCAPQGMRAYFEAMFKNCCSGYLFVAHCSRSWLVADFGPVPPWQLQLRPPFCSPNNASNTNTYIWIVCICVYISPLSLSIYIYIHTYLCIHMHLPLSLSLSIYIYIHTHDIISTAQANIGGCAFGGQQAQMQGGGPGKSRQPLVCVTIFAILYYIILYYATTYYSTLYDRIIIIVNIIDIHIYIYIYICYYVD